MGPGAEPPVLELYRHLLRTASADWQETAHRHALLALGPDVRAALLAEVQGLLLAGTRLHPDDVHAVARLMVLAERRRPRHLLDGLPQPLLHDLALAVVTSPTGRMLAAGVDIWDGSDPPRPPEPRPEPDHHQRWHEQRATPGEAGELSALVPHQRPVRR
ncbi:MAG TPA: hypothetical protein VLA55_09525 [Ornithinibacter sp.]|nr:hypothetical protein [Ornithinibacter sp.]